MRARSSEGSVNSSALKGIAPSAVSDTNDFSVDEKQMWPALTRRKSMSLYLNIEETNICSYKDELCFSETQFNST